MELDEILADRGKTYGEFDHNARLSQELKDIGKSHCKVILPAIHAEALDMIFLKISRILTGDPNHVDSWDDIAGYAKLVADHVRS